MKREVEILVKINDRLENVEKALQQFNSKKKISKTIDTYYFDPLREDLKPGLDSRLAGCFRVREKDSKITLTYKKDVFTDNDEWLYSNEHETEVNDLDEIQHIIENLGFEILVVVDNTKHTYETDEYEIVIEEVKDLGLFLEVESREDVDESDILSMREKIRTFIDSLNCKIGSEQTSGKPELLLKQQNYSDN